jgi:dTDP-4-dehydrorhamnose reductase
MYLIVGGDGMIGGRLAGRLRVAGEDVLETTRRPGEVRPGRCLLDLAGDPERWELPGAVGVAYLCAAVTSVERCQREPDLTRRVNVEHTLALARRLRDCGAHVVFLSTNQVFDGTQPYRGEDEPTCPGTEYGRQKAEVEAALLAAGGTAVVRLTKVLGGVPRLFRQWRESLARGEAVRPFHDMVFSPVDLDTAVDVLVRVGRERLGGVLHLSADRDVSYAEVANCLARRLQAGALVQPESFTSRGLPAALAPRHTTLATARLRRELGVATPEVWKTVDALIEETLHA